MGIPETLGERLRSAMRRAGVRNQAVADAAGVHVKTVSKWLSDAQTPDAEALDAVAATLRVSASWLRYGGPVETPGGLQAPGRSGSPEALNPPRRLPPPVYAAMHGYVQQLEQRGLRPDQVEEAEGMLVDFMYSALFPKAVKDRTDEELVSYAGIMWEAIKRGLSVAHGGFRSEAARAAYEALPLADEGEELTAPDRRTRRAAGAGRSNPDTSGDPQSSARAKRRRKP